MATSPSQQVDAQSLPPRAPNEAESVISSLVYGYFSSSFDLISSFHFAYNFKLLSIFSSVTWFLLSMISCYRSSREIDQNSLGVLEEIKKCKDSALERQKCLEDEKEQFQKAAYTVLEMLNSRE
ncbi:hypothetical protein V6N13_081396 [Hibiscus sabdariffa]